MFEDIVKSGEERTVVSNSKGRSSFICYNKSLFVRLINKSSIKQS